MSSRICRSAARAARNLLSRTTVSGGRAVAGATAVSCRGTLAALATYVREGSGNASKNWITGPVALPASEEETYAAEMERIFMTIKPDGAQRISEILSCFERKGFKLVSIEIVIPTIERPFFKSLCNFLSSGPVVSMVWEGEGVIEYGQELIVAAVFGRNIIHGSDGLKTAKDEISLRLKPGELVSYSAIQRNN